MDSQSKPPPASPEWELDHMEDFKSAPVFAIHKHIPKETNATPRNRPTSYQKWTREEDDLLKRLVLLHPQDWKTIATSFPDKSSTSVKKRWDLRHNPATKKSKWTAEEDQTILRLRARLGGGYWKTIAKYLPGRPPDAIKNRYYCSLRRKKRLDDVPTQNPDPSDSQSDDSLDPDEAQVDEEAIDLLTLHPAASEPPETQANTLKISEKERQLKVEELKGTLESLEQLLQKTKQEIQLISEEINQE